MPRTNQQMTPEKIISPPARRTRSARKRRQSESEKLGVQEKDVSTPQLTQSEDIETATPKVIKSDKGEGQSSVPLPPLPSTPLPPLPPSGRPPRSTRKKSQVTAQKPEDVLEAPSTPNVPKSTRKKKQIAAEPKKVNNPVNRSARKRKQATPVQKKTHDAVQEQPKSIEESSASKRKKPSKPQTPKKAIEKDGSVGKVPKKATAPVKPQMAVQVHRFRNVNYIPKGIIRLCSTPFSPENNYCPQLAVSREGGSVELVSVNEKWKCVGIVEGLKNRSIDAMAWVSGDLKSKDEPQQMITDEPGQNSFNKGTYFCPEHRLATEVQMNRRLFGASRDGTIFEIDFSTKRHSGIIGSGGGAVFCLSSLSSFCNDISPSCGKLLAAGCEDGSIRIYKATEKSGDVGDDQPCLELVSTLPSVGGAVLSVAWLPGSGTYGMEGSIIYAGAADGTIRKFDCTSALQNARNTGNAPRAISTGAVLNSDDVDMEKDAQLSSLQWKAGLRMTVENRGRRSATKIWALQALRDGTVVSGDSMGNVQFWDGNAGTLLQSFEHNPNNGDVFDLAVSYDQNKVMASGVDSKVICIERVPSSSCSESKWVLTNQQRSHTHDVNSLAMVYLTDTAGNLKSLKKPRELLCTGGVDTKVCSYFVTNMKKYRAKVAYKYPTKAPITISKGPRILSIMRSDKVDFYQLANLRVNANVGNIALNEEQAHLGSVGITSNFNLVSFDVSDDGKFLAISHTGGLMLYTLRFVNDEDNASQKIVVPKKVNVPFDADVSCSALKFGGSGFLICATTNGPINLIRFDDDSESTSATLDYTLNPTSVDAYKSEYSPFVQLAVSADGLWFAAARNALGKGSVQVFSLTKKQHWWTLPCTEAPQSCIKFLGGEGKSDIEPALAVACNNGVVYLFDFERRSLSDWSQDLGFPASPHLPRELSSCPHCPETLAYNAATVNKFVMGGHSWFCSIDLNSQVPLRSKPYPKDHFKARNWNKAYIQERRRSKSSDQNNSKTIEEEMRKDDANRNFTICLRYSGIVFQDFLDKNEMVVVEQPWLSIVNTLPDALERQRYGS